MNKTAQNWSTKSLAPREERDKSAKLSADESEQDECLEELINLKLAGKDTTKTISALDRLHRNKIRDNDISGQATPKNNLKLKPRSRASDFTLSINPVSLF